MEIIHTPWRRQYVQSPDREGEGCVFCGAFSTKKPSLENLVVYRDKRVAVMLNRYPYTNGHVLIIPRTHVDSLTGLDQPTRSALAEVMAFSEGLLRRVYNPEGFNVGLNLGQAAGAGISDHLHFHVVPRWNGDTNFITLFGKLRVIPEDLARIFQRLREAYPARIDYDSGSESVSEEP